MTANFTVLAGAPFSFKSFKRLWNDPSFWKTAELRVKRLQMRIAKVIKNKFYK